MSQCSVAVLTHIATTHLRCRCRRVAWSPLVLPVASQAGGDGPAARVRHVGKALDILASVAEREREGAGSRCRCLPNRTCTYGSKNCCSWQAPSQRAAAAYSAFVPWYTPHDHSRIQGFQKVARTVLVAGALPRTKPLLLWACFLCQTAPPIPTNSNQKKMDSPGQNRSQF